MIRMNEKPLLCRCVPEGRDMVIQREISLTTDAQPAEIAQRICDLLELTWIDHELCYGSGEDGIIAPINAAISSNVIKKFSEVSAVNLTDAKKASVTNSNATNNNYFMKVACTH